MTRAANSKAANKAKAPKVTAPKARSPQRKGARPAAQSGRGAKPPACAVPAPQKPPPYSPDLGRRICERVALGEAIVEACKAERVHPRQWYRWLNEKEDLNEQLDRARRMRADQLAAEILDIADDPELDPHRARLMVDTRKWLAARFFPRMYSEPARVALVTDPMSVAVELAFDFTSAQPSHIISATAEDVSADS